MLLFPRLFFKISPLSAYLGHNSLITTLKEFLFKNICSYYLFIFDKNIVSLFFKTLKYVSVCRSNSRIVWASLSSFSLLTGGRIITEMAFRQGNRLKAIGLDNV